MKLNIKKSVKKKPFSIYNGISPKNCNHYNISPFNLAVKKILIMVTFSNYFKLTFNC